MSWLTNLFGAQRAVDIASLPLASPWADSSSIETLAIAEALQVELSRLPLDRKLAMTVPAVARGRGLIVSAASQLPLEALNEQGPVPVQPTFLYRSDSVQSPQERISRTIDDLIFNGDSLWAVQRGAKSDGAAYGPILDAVWVPRSRWKIDRDSRILIDGEPVEAEEVIHFPKGDGLLETGMRTLRGAISLEESWISRAANPIPMTVIRHDSQAGELEEFEVGQLLSDWSAARSAANGAIGYLPSGLTIDTHGEVDAALFVEGRNAIRVDIASHLNIPASLLDGSVAEASLTYITTEGQNNRFFTETMPTYLGPIEWRLSQDDVVPRGQRVRFNTSQLTASPASPTGAPVED